MDVRQATTARAAMRALGMCPSRAPAHRLTQLGLARRTVGAASDFLLLRHDVPVALAGALPTEADGATHNGPAVSLGQETADLVLDLPEQLALTLR